MKCATAIRSTALAVAALTLAADVASQPSPVPEILVVQAGGLTLRAQLWRPTGSGRFPAVLFNHGSYNSTDDLLPPSDPEILGSVFARHGYVFLCLYRQGIGLSSGQGVSDGDQMARALQAKGVEGRNRTQLRLLENDELREASAALAQRSARTTPRSERGRCATRRSGRPFIWRVPEPSAGAAGSRHSRRGNLWRGCRQLGSVVGASGTFTRRCRTHVGTGALPSRRERLLDRAGVGARRRNAAAGQASRPQDLPAVRSGYTSRTQPYLPIGRHMGVGRFRFSG